MLRQSKDERTLKSNLLPASSTAFASEMIIFQSALDHIDQTPFVQSNLELKVGVWLNSVVLKIQKPVWRNPDAKPFKSGIFFSIWVNEPIISTSKIYYNIHALKLRELRGFRIQSRDFAGDFRERFKPFKQGWPNVSTAFGPLTLMEGWVGVD